MHSIQGTILRESISLFVRVRVPAGEDWRDALGVEALVENEGGL